MATADGGMRRTQDTTDMITAVSRPNVNDYFSQRVTINGINY
jgi:hypothetical protein